MIKFNNRDQRILDYLRENPKGITVAECIKTLKTTELRKAVSTLNRKGFDVQSVWESGENSFGEPIHYKRYFLMTNGAKKQ